ncbi:hypothetical protein [Halopseudomonas pertucinogena]|uniref:hypothetical protein n=1 Tax=Halopseudomonas pertucinogena TaxID=86175 RepID=UPI00166E2192|nr:hypothetical protein [Halopseudomonas pertucinogena]
MAKKARVGVFTINQQVLFRTDHKETCHTRGASRYNHEIFFDFLNLTDICPLHIVKLIAVCAVYEAACGVTDKLIVIDASNPSL